MGLLNRLFWIVLLLVILISMELLKLIFIPMLHHTPT